MSRFISEELKNDYYECFKEQPKDNIDYNYIADNFANKISQNYKIFGEQETFDIEKENMPEDIIYDHEIEILKIKYTVLFFRYKDLHDIPNKLRLMLMGILSKKIKQESLAKGFRLSRPDFGIELSEEKQELNHEWSFLIKHNLWRDNKGKQVKIQDMCLDYIYNCILFLKGTTCGKYIPDEQLRMRYISLFQNEISRRDTLRKLTNKINPLQKLNDLLLKWKKENHNWQDIDHSSLKYKDYNSKYEDLIKEMKWKDSEGYVYYIKDMRNGHLVNTIDYLAKKLLRDIPPMSESEKRLFERYKLLMETELNIRNQIKEVMSMNEYFMTESELLKGKKYQDLEGVMALRCGLDIDELVKINGERFKDEDEDLYTQVDREMRMKSIEEVKKKSERWSGSEHNYKDLEKNVNKKPAHGTKYWNMPYDELVKQGLWKDADNNIYIISSMRNGHIANIMDMLNTNKYSLDMSSETKEKYKDLFLDEFRIRNALKNAEPQILSKGEHIDLHRPGKKENDVVNRPAHYANRKYEPINVISDWKLDFLLGNTVKYISRLGLKDDPKQDINKALFYLIYKCKELDLTQEEIEKTVKQIFSM